MDDDIREDNNSNVDVEEAKQEKGWDRIMWSGRHQEGCHEQKAIYNTTSLVIRVTTCLADKGACRIVPPLFSQDSWAQE